MPGSHSAILATDCARDFKHAGNTPGTDGGNSYFKHDAFLRFLIAHRIKTGGAYSRSSAFPRLESSMPKIGDALLNVNDPDDGIRI
jgi:hypothetical protein